MMAKTQVENQVCNACGADVRAGALFCYSCGGSVAPEVVVALKDKKNVSDAWFREELKEEKNGSKSTKIEQPIVEKAVDKPIPKPDINEESKLKSAAAIRRKSKIYQPKRIETIWEEHDNAPNGWFIAVAIGLTLFAVGIFYLAAYLK